MSKRVNFYYLFIVNGYLIFALFMIQLNHKNLTQIYAVNIK